MNSTNIKGKLNQLITVSITVTILLFTLFFTIWTYRVEKAESGRLLREKLTEVQKITRGLVEVQKLKLDSLSRIIVNGPMLKGALATNHEKTIVDILDNIKIKNELSFIVILEKKNIKFADSETREKYLDIKSVTSGKFISANKIQGYTVLIGKTLPPKELNQWSDITGARFVLRRKNGDLIVKNFEGEDKNITALTSARQTEDNKFIIGTQWLLKETLNVTQLVSTDKIRKSFIRKRNKLIVFGMILSFVGFVMSLLLSKVILKIINSNSYQSSQHQFAHIIDEINELKGKIGEEK